MTTINTPLPPRIEMAQHADHVERFLCQPILVPTAANLLFCIATGVPVQSTDNGFLKNAAPPTSTATEARLSAFYGTQFAKIDSPDLLEFATYIFHNAVGGERADGKCGQWQKTTNQIVLQIESPRRADQSLHRFSSLPQIKSLSLQRLWLQ